MITAVFSGTTTRDPSVIRWADEDLLEPSPRLLSWKMPGATMVCSSKVGATKKSVHWSARVPPTAPTAALTSPITSPSSSGHRVWCAYVWANLASHRSLGESSDDQVVFSTKGSPHAAHARVMPTISSLLAPHARQVTTVLCELLGMYLLLTTSSAW